MNNLKQAPLQVQAALASIQRHHMGDELQNVYMLQLALIGPGATGTGAGRWVRGMWPM
ncbi:hypothetical protein [Roseomonas sp. USHLN139]|uniref:hypothetical protein n=1 Tax=Roseomonas sp. USHLN139 TaxID=3081298 RepID=UPI003B0129BB